MLSPSLILLETGVEKRRLTVTVVAYISSSHMVQTKTPDNKDLVFLSGTAVVSYPFIATGAADNWHNDNLAIHIDPPKWTNIEHVAPVVTLASIVRAGSVNFVGWAVEWTDWVPYSGHILLTSNVGVYGNAAILFKVSYQTTAIGTLA
jgi:hypothetical protein